jgi:hypothetical protein
MLNITVPIDAAIGTTWLRVTLDADGGDGDYLSYFAYGEMEEYAIDVTGPNTAPTDITLSANSINENVVANSTVGTLSSTDSDAGNTFTYTLVAGTGSTDNASFNISGSSLRITNSPNFETKSSYSVRVRTTDQGSLFFEKQFTITINDLNEAPTDIALSASAINENVAANSAVGTLSSTDPDAANTFTYTLVAGTGSTDNASFNISGSNLRISDNPDFETKSSYSVRVRTTDQGSLFFEKQFTITINNVNEAPTDLALSASSINENVAANSAVGTLSSTDPDAGNTFTYTLVAGTGDTDNGAFNLSGSSLRITNNPDFETKSSYSVRVRTTDQGGLFFDKQFAITVTDIPDGIIRQVVFDPADPFWLYAGVDAEGIWLSTDNGATWAASSTGLTNMRVRSLALKSGSPVTLYAATYGGGIFQSTDSAVTWVTCANNGLTGAGLNVTALVIDPAGTLYAGTEAGIFSSADCAIWSPTGNTLPASAGTPPVAIAIAPATPATLYAGIDGAGVYQSSDSGTTWTASSVGLTSLQVKALTLQDANTLYAGTVGGVFVSGNAGATWTACAIQPVNAQIRSLVLAGTTLYAGTEGGVFTSTDGCATWTAMNTGLP